MLSQPVDLLFAIVEIHLPTSRTVIGGIEKLSSRERERERERPLSANLNENYLCVSLTHSPSLSSLYGRK